MKELLKKNWVVVPNIFGIFTPKIGEMIQFDGSHIFQMGWVQPPTRHAFTDIQKLNAGAQYCRSFGGGCEFFSEAKKCVLPLGVIQVIFFKYKYGWGGSYLSLEELDFYSCVSCSYDHHWCFTVSCGYHYCHYNSQETPFHVSLRVPDCGDQANQRSVFLVIVDYSHLQ